MRKKLIIGISATLLAVSGNGLWVGIGGQLLHLDFDLKTNLAVKLPMDGSVPITALSLTSSKIWVGTRGAGLIEFDKASRQCRCLTEADGLMMNSIASLDAAGDSLWVGYGGATGGGLGRLDLLSQKISSYMPSLSAEPAALNDETPPRKELKTIVASPNGDLWTLVGGTLRQFRVARNVWETSLNESGDSVRCFSADSERLVEGIGVRQIEIEIETKSSQTASTNEIKKTKQAVSYSEYSRLKENFRTNDGLQRISWTGYGGVTDRGALAIKNLHDQRWQTVEDADAMPNPPSTMTLDGNDLWVGGEGFIALVDLKEGKVREFCRVKAETVDRIQIAGGYVWAQFDWHLYRKALSELQ